MTEATPEIRTVVVERDFAHKPEKLWRALTQPHLLQEWLMQSDFAPALGHKFRFTADWGGIDCKVKVGAHGSHGSIATVTIAGVAADKRDAVTADVQKLLGPFVMRHEVVFA